MFNWPVLIAIALFIGTPALFVSRLLGASLSWWVVLGPWLVIAAFVAAVLIYLETTDGNPFQ